MIYIYIYIYIYMIMDSCTVAPLFRGADGPIIARIL